MSESGCVELDSHAIDDDIGHYVSRQLFTRREFQRKVFTADIREQIRRKVGAGANGMFRWAACQLDTLVDLRSPKQVEAALNDLPRDLDETYNRILENIPERGKCDTTRLLQFLAHSHRSLTVEEAVEIIATDTDADPPSFDVKGRISEEEEVRQYGPGLISIFSVEYFDGIVKREVRLAHFSVKEFLNNRSDFSQLRANVAITKTCLTYLNNITGSREGILQNFPFGYSAAKTWTRHGASAEQDDDVFRSIMKFFQDQETFSRWYKLIHGDSSKSSMDLGLYHACAFGLVRVAHTLIAKGADVNARSKHNDWYPLAAASAEGHLEIVKILIDNGADINAVCGRHGSALSMAIEKGREDVVRFLLEAGASVNTPTYKAGGDTDGSVLLLALAKGERAISKVLLDMKADVTARGERHGNALCAASEGGLVDLMEIFLKDKSKTDVNAQGGQYGNALQAASLRGHLEAVKLLLEKGADVNLQGGYFGTALQAASARGHLEVAELLLEKGADVNLRGGASGTALRAAMFEDCFEVATLLINEGADINIFEFDWSCAPTAASVRKRSELARHLIDMGKVGHGQGVEFADLLHMASSNGDIELMEFLLEKGADVNALNSDHTSALVAAALENQVAAAKFLVERGADVNAEVETYGSPLYMASINGCIELMEFLLERGADINAGAGLFGSVLQAAAYQNQVEAVKFLVEKGADVHQHDGVFGSALEAAERDGYENSETAKFLRQVVAATEDKSKEPLDQGC